MKTALSIALAATTAFAMTAVAHAQTAAQPAPLAGAVIPGVCVYSNERTIATSAVGLSMIDRLKQLAQQAQAEIQTKGQALESEQAALKAQAASLPKDQLDQRAGIFQQHYEELRRLEQVRQAELEETRNREIEVIGQQVDPLLRQVYAERNCGLVVAATSTYGYFNTQMDVTQAVISKLNAKITTLNFDRVHLDQQGGVAPQAAATQPTSVAATPAKKKK